jgi:hypothetical protein
VNLIIKEFLLLINLNLFIDSIDYNERMRLCVCVVSCGVKSTMQQRKIGKSQIQANSCTVPLTQPHCSVPGSAVSPSLPKSWFKLNEWACELKIDVSVLA